MRGDRHFLCAIVIEYESVYLRGRVEYAIDASQCKKAALRAGDDPNVATAYGSIWTVRFSERFLR
jgi:hypothetical protein